MNYKMMGRFISKIIYLEGIFMIPALIISIYVNAWNAVKGFSVTMGIITVLGSLLAFICRGAERKFYAKEGLVCVGLSWIVMSLLGCLPFVVSKEIPFYIDALFEIVSGFTTTGASILSDVEAMSMGLLYWRSFSHWLGGMGVLVFLLAITGGDSQNSGFTMHLLRAESPGPDVGKLVPRVRETTRILYLLYILLTVLDILLLLLGGMSVFEAVCTAFGTAGTGGFGIKNDSIAGYSPYIQNVCTVFMILFGVNFGCYYLIMLKQIKSVLLDEELRMYLGVIVCSVVVISFNIYHLYGAVEKTVRLAAFQVASIITTTGFATADFDLWPSLSKAILFSLMFVGACAGSTGGGLKIGRALLLFKILRRNIHKVIHPQKIQKIRNSGSVVSENVLDNTNAYLAAYVVIMLVSMILISIDNFSMTTNISAVVACFNNIGPGFEGVGATCNYGGYSWFSKIVLILDMLAGRLEIFPIMILFSKSTWFKK